MKNFLLLMFGVFMHWTVCGQASDNTITVGETIELESTILGENRSILVHHPKGFWGLDAAMEQLPVIIVLDGETQFLHTVATVDFLSSAPLGNDLMPRSIVVAVPNTNRNRDLTPFKGVIANDSSTLTITGGGKAFLDFITDELIPFIDSNYNTSNHRTLVGHSLGGLITFEALLRKRAYFQQYIALDPALGFGDGRLMQEVLDSIQQVDFSKEHFFMATARTQPTFLQEKDVLSNPLDAMRVVDIPNKQFLKQFDTLVHTLPTTAQHYAAESHFSLPHKPTHDGLRALYAYYPFPEMIDYYHPSYKDKMDLVDQVKRHYQTISSKMGYEVRPMAGYLNSFAFGIATAGRHDLAVELLQYNVELYPQNPLVYNNLAYYYTTQGNKKLALEVYKQSIALQSDENILQIIKELENERGANDKN